MSEENRPGHFESELEDYPGSFELPHPFMERHMRLWWQHAMEPLKALDQLDFEFYNADWLGAVELIKQYGSWDIKAVAPADLGTDNVPSLVKAWVQTEADNYIFPFLPLRMRLAVAETFAKG